MITLILFNPAGEEVKRYTVNKFEVEAKENGWVTVYYTTPDGVQSFIDLPSKCGKFKFEFMRA